MEITSPRILETADLKPANRPILTIHEITIIKIYLEENETVEKWYMDSKP